MSDSKRLRFLEQYGQVPEDAEHGDKDWALAQRTTWWGKPLDPETFWQGRVKWLDDKNNSASYRRGRLFPPIPTENTNLPPYLNDDRLLGQSSVDAPSVRYASSSAEAAYWDKFPKTHPQPPERIEQRQMHLSKEILVARYRYEHEGNPYMTTEARLMEMAERGKATATSAGYPPESLGDEALFWAYVMMKRQQYEDEIKPLLGTPAATTAYTILFDQLPVDSKLVSEPLTDEQLKAANGWKIAYLQRLRREKTDESYIKAYLEAWNLSEEEVFLRANEGQ